MIYSTGSKVKVSKYKTSTNYALAIYYARAIVEIKNLGRAVIVCRSDVIIVCTATGFKKFIDVTCPKIFILCCGDPFIQRCLFRHFNIFW